ncbi:hypothetical protein TNCV_4011361 [Trichonephila clavipes]|nr:hypothetical protein TNCV_4011361 [Trichonephila clavipes]
MGPGKRSKHSQDQSDQFAKENGNRAAARMLDICISNSLDGTKDDYFFMEESNSNRENDTALDNVLEDITGDEYADLFMLSNNESS